MGRKLKQLNLKKLKNKDPQAVRRWFDEYADSLYTIIYYRIDKDADLACDIVQQTFLTALSKINEYQPKKASMITWLSCLAKNYTKKLLREKNRNLSYSTEDHTTNNRLLDKLEKITEIPLPEDIIQQTENRQLVQTALAQIRERYRNILRLYYYEQNSITQIATALHISPAASRILLHRAKKAFKNQLLKSAESIDDFYID